MKTPFKLRHAVFGALLLGSAIALSAEPEGPRVDVSYQDLNLSRPADVQKLYKRITVAARKVCQVPGANAAGQLAAYSNCFKNAINNAVASVNSQELTALHESRTQRARAS